MKNIYKSIICFIILGVTGTPNQFAYSLNKVIVNGTPFYRYEVKKGDTMFGIARDNGWDFEVLQQYNTGLISPLHKGMNLYYPANEKSVNEGNNLQQELDSIDIQGSSTMPLQHKIKCGETLEAISRMYGITISDIRNLNPGLDKNCKAGTVITLMAEDSSRLSDGNQPRYHTVTGDETISAIADRYGVSVRALMESNPGLSPHHFIVGNVLKIPVRGTGVKIGNTEIIESGISTFHPYKAKNDDTWENIAYNNNIDKNLLLAANPDIKLKKNIYLGIPVTYNDTILQETIVKDPREESFAGIAEIYDEVHKFAKEDKPEIKIALILDEPASKKDVEYLRGFLTGVEKLKNGEAKIILNVIDGNRPSTESIALLDEFRPTIIISTAEKSMPHWISEYGETRETSVVNTFDVKNDQYITNPYIIQLITPSEYFNEKVAEYIINQYKGYALVFVGEKDENDALAEALRQSWNPAKVRDRSIVDLTTLPLSANEKYLMYGYAIKKNDISELLGAIENATQRQPLAEVNVLGRPNWIIYTDALGDKFNTASVMIPSRFYVDKDSRGVTEFTNDYKTIFDRQLMRSFPSYGIAGYDTAIYFIEGLTAAKSDVNSLSESNHLLQSYYYLRRPANWSGMLNTGVFLLRHMPYGSVEKIILK